MNATNPRRLLAPLSVLLCHLGSDLAPAMLVECSATDTWAPTSRPERLEVYAWNTPVTGGNDPQVAPAPEGAGPIAVSLSRSVISDHFGGDIVLVVEGLSLGQSVLLEKFRIDNDQGLITAGAVLQGSHLITDGVVPQAGGVRNSNPLQDTTGRDGRIETRFDFRKPTAANIPGRFVFRVSSPLDSFPAQTAQLTVNDIVTPQHFTGRVTAAGEPVPGAYIALLHPLATYADFVKGTSADAKGDYTLYAPFENEFDLVALKPGYVGPIAVGTAWEIEAGQSVPADLELERGTTTISGTLADPATGTPVPGMELFLITTDADGAFDFRKCSVVWTDAQGRFAAGVTADRWGLMVRAQMAAGAGRVTSSHGPLARADTTAGADVTSLDVPLPLGTSIIWGNLWSTEIDDWFGLEPIDDVEIMAINHDTQQAVWGLTDADGSYRLAVPPGRWNVFPFSYSIEDRGFPGFHDADVSVPAADQSIYQDFYARPKTGELYGEIRDEAGDPVGRLRLLALNTDLDIDEGVLQSTFQSDGYYCFFLADGEWVMFPDARESAKRGLLYKDLPRVRVVEDATDDYEIDIKVVAPTASIDLTITDAAGNPVPGQLAHARGLAGRSVYDSFGRTDAEGRAELPALPGQWILHVSPTTTGLAGKREIPLASFEVTGQRHPIALEAVDFTGTDSGLLQAGWEGGAFTITGAGESGRRYFIQGSEDLGQWFDVGSVRAVDGRFEVEDHTFSERMFYRVVHD